MPRLTTTRLKTREAANNLLQLGSPLTKITVDAVYTRIRQGSRSTITDELNLWKQEQMNVLGSLLSVPSELRNAFSDVWALAQEYIERDLSVAKMEQEKLIIQNDQLAQVVSVLKNEIEILRCHNVELHKLIANERKEKDILAEKHSLLETEIRHELVLASERYDALQKNALLETDRARQALKSQKRI